MQKDRTSPRVLSQQDSPRSCHPLEEDVHTECQTEWKYFGAYPTSVPSKSVGWRLACVFQIRLSPDYQFFSSPIPVDLIYLNHQIQQSPRGPELDKKEKKENRGSAANRARRDEYLPANNHSYRNPERFGVPASCVVPFSHRLGRSAASIRVTPSCNTATAIIHHILSSCTSFPPFRVYQTDHQKGRSLFSI